MKLKIKIKPTGMNHSFDRITFNIIRNNNFAYKNRLIIFEK